jgi:hypothetical protein
VRDGGGLSSRWPYRRRGDGLEQMRPVPEDDIGGDGPQMLEEAIRGAACDDGSLPGDDPEVSGGVECEGQQIEGDQNTGKGFAAVSKVVPKVGSVSLEHVEGLVLDLPAGAAAGGQFGDGVAGDSKIRDEAVVIRSLSPGVEDLDGEPVDQDGIAGGIEALERRRRSGYLDRLEKQPIERCRRGTVQHQADVVVGGIAAMPNNVSQFDLPRPSASAR